MKFQSKPGTPERAAEKKSAKRRKHRLQIRHRKNGSKS